MIQKAAVCYLRNLHNSIIFKCTYRYIRYFVIKFGSLMDKLKDIVLDPNSVISLHAQLHSQLRQLILSGRWQKGSLIPSESQLSNYLKVSRSTVRLALQ